MGDRANVRVVQEADGRSVFLYTHWGGTELAAIVQTALKRRQRWDDCAYLTRIIFSEMLIDAAGDAAKTHATLKDETGFGITVYPIDERIVTVDVPAQRITFDDGVPQTDVVHETAAREVAAEKRKGKKLPGWSFDEFIALTDKQLDAKWSPEG